MITPAGTECRYYYEDYYRGREKQECRLIARNPRSEPWRPELCKACPVPGILRANASPNLVLEARVEKGFLGLRRRVVVDAVCSKHLIEIKDPHVGCRLCNEEQRGKTILEIGEG
ncbi:MAG: hypothetical protein ACK2UC_02195 [Anaerolineae bacterium]